MKNFERLWLVTSFGVVAVLSPSLAFAHGNAMFVTIVLTAFAVLPLLAIEALLTVFMTRDGVRRRALITMPLVAIAMLVLVTVLVSMVDSTALIVGLSFLTTAAIGAPLTLGLWRSSRRRAALINLAFCVLLLPLGMLIARSFGYNT